MNLPRWTGPLRHSEGGELLEAFFVAAVASVLSIRWFLTLTGFPKVGGAGLHIAHMLWGGLFMLVALVLLFAYLDRSVTRLAAILAGIGFGTFIDEIGKFVTSDNDYFFQPAVSLIYVVFVALFLVIRAITSSPRLSEREALANALDVLEDDVGRPITAHTRREILRLLQRADPADSLGEAVHRYVIALPTRVEAPSPVARVVSRVDSIYDRLVAHPAFGRIMLVAAVLYAVAAVGAEALLVLVLQPPGHGSPSGVAEIGELGSGLIGAVLVLRGALELASSRLHAYRWFVRGFLVWILVTQVFLFYEWQLQALAGLAVDLIAYAALRYMISRERALGRHVPPSLASSAEPSAASPVA